METGVLEQFDHEAWRALGGATVAYLAILGVLFAVLFVLPLILFIVL